MEFLVGMYLLPLPSIQFNPASNWRKVICNHERKFWPAFCWIWKELARLKYLRPISTMDANRISQCRWIEAVYYRRKIAQTFHLLHTYITTYIQSVHHHISKGPRDILRKLQTKFNDGRKGKCLSYLTLPNPTYHYQCQSTYILHFKVHYT